METHDQENALKPGEELQHGKYVIQKILGQGGFGITYLARNTGLKTDVAIKELFLSGQTTYCTRHPTEGTVAPHFDKTKYEGFKKGFTEEARTLRLFKGIRGIVQVMAIFEERGTVYFVMDYVAGTPLRDLVEQNGPFTEARALACLHDLLDVLEAVHAKNVLHRDINPNNILMGTDGRPVLIDFGIARGYEEGVAKTHTTFRTAGYSAPEQAVKKAERGAFTDIYSLGGVLYFMLTGEPPQSSEEIDLEGFKSPKDLNPAISDTLDAAAVRALRKKPSERFQSAGEFREGLLSEKLIVKSEKPKVPDNTKTLIDGKAGDNSKTLVDEEGSEKLKVKSEKLKTPEKEKPVLPTKEEKRRDPALIALLIGLGIAAAGFGYWALRPNVPTQAELAAIAQADSLRRSDSLAVVLAAQTRADSLAKLAGEAVALKLAEENAKLAEADETAWKAAKKARSKEAFEKYLADFPEGKHKDEASKAMEDDGIEMVYVAGGSFNMGSPVNEANRGSDETQHRVSVSGFYMGKYEVTQDQWVEVMGSNPSSFKNCGSCPVEQVSWDDAQKFIRKLNEKSGKGYRLPTEAEWEYAARGGSQSNGYLYSGGNSLGSVAWYDGNSGSKTHSVGGKKGNELGLYDMSGNVWEWCQDWYGDSYYSNSPSNNPKGPSSGSYRVLRGGSWGDNALNCRSGVRFFNSPSDRSLNGGFRLCKTN